jgi:hypothetical protein
MSYICDMKLLSNFIDYLKRDEEPKIRFIVKEVHVKKNGKCVCEMPGVSGYCHIHKTDWV